MYCLRFLHVLLFGSGESCLTGLCEAVDGRGEYWQAQFGKTEIHNCTQGSNPESEYNKF
jgi:hypothetical protein